MEFKLQGDFIGLQQTWLAEGAVGISMFSRQFFGKVPFSMSPIAAFISGKQTSTASLKSLS